MKWRGGKSFSETQYPQARSSPIKSDCVRGGLTKILNCHFCTQSLHPMRRCFQRNGRNASAKTSLAVVVVQPSTTTFGDKQAMARTLIVSTNFIRAPSTATAKRGRTYCHCATLRNFRQSINAVPGEGTEQRQYTHTF